MFKFSRISFFFIVFFHLSIKAQENKGFKWVAEDNTFFSIEKQKGIITKEAKNNEKIELGTIQDWDSIKKELPKDFDINVFVHKNKTLITVLGTGQLYELNLPKFTLNRLDKTFFRGYNFLASQFIRKDTLFSVGGEGFWQKNNLITFYNSKTLEWELYKSKNKNPDPVNFRFSGYSPKYDKFFSAFIEADSILADKDVFLYDFSFKNKTWERKGRLNKEILNFTKKEYWSIWTGEYMILYRDYGYDNAILIDPFKNTFYHYAPLNDSFFMRDREVYYKNGHVISRGIINTSGKKEELMVNIISLKEMIRKSKEVAEVYEKNGNTLYYIISVILLMMIFGAVVFYKNKFVKKPDDDFSDLELSIIKEIINNPIERKFTTLEINTLLDINTKSYDNQRQIRNRVISGINHKLYSFFDSKDFICRSPNIDDKRMMDYYLNPEIRKREIKILHKQIFEN